MKRYDSPFLCKNNCEQYIVDLVSRIAVMEKMTDRSNLPCAEDCNLPFIDIQLCLCSYAYWYFKILVSYAVLSKSLLISIAYKY